MKFIKGLVFIVLSFCFDVTAESLSFGEKMYYKRIYDDTITCESFVEKLITPAVEKAKQGDVSAKAYLGFYLPGKDNGKICWWDRTEEQEQQWEKWLNESYKANHKLALFIKGALSNNYEEKYRLLKESASKGFGEAQFRLSELLMDNFPNSYLLDFRYSLNRKNIEIEVDREEGVRQVKLAAKNGSPGAQWVLSRFHLPYSDTYEMDYERAFQLLHKAAKSNFGAAAADLAGFYVRGWRLDRDYEKAIALLEPFHESIVTMGLVEDELPIWKIMLNCEVNSKSEVLGHKFNCMDRATTRNAIKSKGVRAIREDDNYLTDTYDSVGSSINGSTQIKALFTADDMLSRITINYNQEHIPKVRKSLTDKYGEPELDFGDLIWQRKDGLKIKLDPDKNTLSYTNPINLESTSFVNDLVEKKRSWAKRKNNKQSNIL